MIRNLTRNGLAACGLALAMATSLSAQTPIEGAARVVRIVGSARYRAPGGSWQSLQVGDLVKPGTMIQTSMGAAGSYVDLVLDRDAVPVAQRGPLTLDTAPADFNAAHPPTLLGFHASASQNVIRIFEDTALGIDKLSSMQTGAGRVSDTELDLRKGHIFVNVKKMNMGSRYEVKMPNGVAGIRGSSVEFFASGKIITGPNTKVTAAFMDSNNQAVTKDMGDFSVLDMMTGLITPATPEEISAIGTLVRDLVAIATSVDHFVAYSPDFTVFGPMSRNSVNSPGGTTGGSTGGDEAAGVASSHR